MQSLARAECPCPACGRFTTARNTIDGSGRRECPSRRCGTIFSVGGAER